MSTSKSTDNKTTDNKTTALENKSIAELLEIAEHTKRLLEQRQQAIRETAVKQIQDIAKEAGIKVWIREPKQRDVKVEKLYRNPDDHSQTYNGKGASPKWLKDKIAGGAKKDDFLVKAETASSNDKTKSESQDQAKA